MDTILYYDRKSKKQNLFYSIFSLKVLISALQR